jgi:hypothetical protein
MFATLRVGLTVGLGLWAAAGSAVAQQPCATCPADGATRPGPVVCGAAKAARGVHPWMQKHHARKFGHVTIHPDSCFGHYRTNWTAWEQACPHWCAEPVAVPGPVVAAPPVVTAPAPAEPAPAPKEQPPAKEPEKEPVKESIKLPPVTAPTPVKTDPVSTPTNTPGLGLPPVPDLPIGLPPAPPAGPSKS